MILLALWGASCLVGLDGSADPASDGARQPAVETGDGLGEEGAGGREEVSPAGASSGTPGLSERDAERMRSLLGEAPRASSCEAFLADLSAEVDEDGQGAVAWTEDAGLVDAARAVLEAYRDETSAELAASGYLDLMGNAWGALLRAEGSWVDIVFVSTDDDERSAVRIVRLAP